MQNIYKIYTKWSYFTQMMSWARNLYPTDFTNSNRSMVWLWYFWNCSVKSWSFSRSAFERGAFTPSDLIVRCDLDFLYYIYEIKNRWMRRIELFIVMAVECFTSIIGPSSVRWLLRPQHWRKSSSVLDIVLKYIVGKL